MSVAGTLIAVPPASGVELRILEEGSSIENCSAGRNGSTGIYAEPGGSVVNCTSSSNGLDGFVIDDGLLRFLFTDANDSRNQIPFIEERVEAQLQRYAVDVAGEPVTGVVTSFRVVEWDSFRPNFFMVLSPGLLPEEAGTFISSAHVPGDQRQLFVDIARELPGVTVFDMEALLGQVRGVMDKAALAVQIVFLFTLAAGVVVLLAAVQASLGERRYEAAMLRTLGARRSLVLRAIATEFVVVGMLAGLLAAIGAGVAGAALFAGVGSGCGGDGGGGGDKDAAGDATGSS